MASCAPAIWTLIGCRCENCHILAVIAESRREQEVNKWVDAEAFGRRVLSQQWLGVTSHWGWRDWLQHEGFNGGALNLGYQGASGQDLLQIMGWVARVSPSGPVGCP